MLEQFWKIVWHFLKGEKKNQTCSYHTIQQLHSRAFISEMKTYFRTKSGTVFREECLEKSVELNDGFPKDILKP